MVLIVQQHILCLSYNTCSLLSTVQLFFVLKKKIDAVLIDLNLLDLAHSKDD